MKTHLFKIKNIKWDLSEAMIEDGLSEWDDLYRFYNLPYSAEYVLDTNIELNTEDVEEICNEWLSGNWGFCVLSYEVEHQTTKEYKVQ